MPTKKPGYWRKDSATFKRLWTSEHVTDLKWITITALSAIVIAIIALGSYYDTHMYLDPDQLKTENLRNLTSWQRFTKDFDPKFIISIIAVASGLIAWAYRTAATRLGVVDLFASEIITLCRVGTIADLGRYGAKAHSYNATSEDGAFRPHKFTSGENYFPVFSANSHDLEVLEADVINKVAAFYTYMKVLRDTLRQIGELTPDWNVKSDIMYWKNQWENFMYMTLLSYEAARHSVTLLIEYEPNEVENSLTILLTEVLAYDFLLEKLPPNDFRRGRLILRMEGYKEELQRLQDRFNKQLDEPDPSQAADWDKAFELWEQLHNRLLQTVQLKWLGMNMKRFPIKSAGWSADQLAPDVADPALAEGGPT